ncbi:hypothetical protein [Pseudoduganella albidiflava]|uniref:Uncharacterized protein n=1 Tax=Pseudoduganella albidiflava TaxID=321983 RepID=A0ABX5RZ10_9BURK|nr:hypothetical protein [Pseudoduganella albidiflava]QBI03294.1 hypothetical protein EYF70_22540 [Pseudoduganella albidiflava]
MSDITWVSACCGEACLYAEFKVETGYIKVKTRHDETDLDYEVRRYGLDFQPVDAQFVTMTEADLEKLLEPFTYTAI